MFFRDAEARIAIFMIRILSERAINFPKDQHQNFIDNTKTIENYDLNKHLM